MTQAGQPQQFEKLPPGAGTPWLDVKEDGSVEGVRPGQPDTHAEAGTVSGQGDAPEIVSEAPEPQEGSYERFMAAFGSGGQGPPR